MNKTEAAKMLGVSVDFFDEHVHREVACVRRGRRCLYPVIELRKWLERSAEHMDHRVAALSPHIAYGAHRLAHWHVIHSVLHHVRF